MKPLYILAVSCMAGILVNADEETTRTKSNVEINDIKSSETSNAESAEEKRDNEEDIAYEKRTPENGLGGGFMKMNPYSQRMDLLQDLQRMTADKRYWGSVLGRGFITGGKRDNMAEDFDEVYMDTPDDDKRSYPDMFDFTYPEGQRMKRSVTDEKRFYNYFRRGLVLRQNPGNEYAEGYYPENEDSYGVDKRFRSFVLGRGFVLGKRSDDEGDTMDDYDMGSDDGYNLDKRYGFLFNRGFNFGKRHWMSNNDNKRPFGNVLGHGFSFGKRFADAGELEDDTSDQTEMKKRMGLVLGRGFMMGKRGQKRYGWVLGHGLKFGKRTGELDPEEPDYFIGDSGDIYDVRKRAPPKSQVAKRYGFLLGRGFHFGKRSLELTNRDILEDSEPIVSADFGYSGYNKDSTGSHVIKRSSPRGRFV